MNTSIDAGAIQRWTASRLGVACLVVAVACAGRNPAPASSGEAMVRVGRPCPALAPGEAPSLVFIEIADARLPRSRADLTTVTAVPIPIRGIGALIASLGETVSVPWGGCLAEPCEPRLSTLAITPRLRGSDAQHLDLTVQLAPPLGSGEPSRTLALQARDQQPALLRFDDGAPSKPVAWIVTPYLMNSREGLQQMRTCKLAALPKRAP